MNGALPKPIVFITGVFVSHCCWDEWKLFFENEGYKCIVPPWPYKEAGAEELRNRSTDDPIAFNTITSLTDHITTIISELDEKPILIGHSLGGLIAQALLQRGLACAVVAIHSFPPSGIHSLKFSLRMAVWKFMTAFSSDKKTYLIPFSTWRYTVTQGMDYHQQKELYYRYAIPESRKLIRECLKSATKIDFKKPHAPLLFTSGSNDQLIPASLNYHNYKKYADDISVTEYFEFKGHSHLVFGVPDWKKEADQILHWLKGIL